MRFSGEQKEGLLKLAKKKSNGKIKIKTEVTMQEYLSDEETLKQILSQCGFKEIGNVFDFPKFLKPPKHLYGADIAKSYDTYERITISKKYNAILIYTISDHYYHIVVTTDVKNIKKLSEAMGPIIKQDFGEVNIFRDTDFKCGKAEYLEIGKNSGKAGRFDSDEDGGGGRQSKNPYTAIKKEVQDEKLVFDKDSVLNEVVTEITGFFTEETKDLYKKFDIPYKRGALLWGPPGTGKTASIREIIRRVGSDVSKIIINSNVGNKMPYVLSSLIRALNGKQAIIIMEDMDSMITDRNRSEFLNILDGTEVKSGIYIIGTTNYRERIDKGIVNRVGRFDKQYHIDTPTEETRRLFFESKNLLELFDAPKKGDIAELFAKYTDKLPMATLKEVITTAKYVVINNPGTKTEDAVKEACARIKGDISSHDAAHSKFLAGKKKKKKNKGLIDFLKKEDNEVGELVAATGEDHELVKKMDEKDGTTNVTATDESKSGDTKGFKKDKPKALIPYSKANLGNVEGFIRIVPHPDGKVKLASMK